MKVLMSLRNLSCRGSDSINSVSHGRERPQGQRGGEQLKSLSISARRDTWTSVCGTARVRLARSHCPFSLESLRPCVSPGKPWYSCWDR